MVHAKTADVYVVTEESGTLATGGQIVGGRIVGGVERAIKRRDVVFIPNGVPHSMRQTPGITWLNIRFDTK